MGSTIGCKPPGNRTYPPTRSPDTHDTTLERSQTLLASKQGPSIGASPTVVLMSFQEGHSPSFPPNVAPEQALGAPITSSVDNMLSISIHFQGHHHQVIMLEIQAVLHSKFNQSTWLFVDIDKTQLFPITKCPTSVWSKLYLS